MQSTVAAIETREKGRVRLLLADDDKLTFASAGGKQIQAALSKGATSAAQLSAHGLGTFGKAFDIPYASVRQLRVHQGTGALRLQYADASGKTNSAEICIRDANQRGAMLERLENKLSERGLQKTMGEASTFSVAWMPVGIAFIALVVGGGLTLLQAGGDGITLPEHSEGGSRSRRRANAVVSSLVGISNTLGFTGTLVVTVALVAAACVYTVMRLKRRPVVLTYA